MIIDPTVKIIAFYLPQFHPIIENDIWWGTGFTEWTNVRKAKPLFKGHYQPRVPSCLGYYDLRQSKIREEQARIAKAAGIYGFCYWHYWFGDGKQLLEGPFNEVLKTGKPDFPFCLGWANESWEAKVWNAGESKSNRILIEQKYEGPKDHELHFFSLLNAFKDTRYICIYNRPLFLIYKPEQFKDLNLFIKQWNRLGKLNGLESGFYFVGHTSNFKEYEILIDLGFDAITVNPMNRLIDKIIASKSITTKIIEKLLRSLIKRKKLNVIEYKQALKFFINKNQDCIENVIPTIIPNWDHSPRSGQNGWILHNSTPEFFEENVRSAIDCVKEKSKENRIIFLKSWNEWGEGNYIEPDSLYGHKYLDILEKVVLNNVKKN